MKLRKRKEKSNNIKTIILTLIIVILICILILSLKITNNSTAYAYEESLQTVNFEENKIEKIENNISLNIRKEIITEEIELEYISIYKEDETLGKGTIQILQEGRNGKQEIVKQRTYENDVLTNEEIISDRIVKASINKIVVTGTAKYKNNYKAKVGDALYVVADTLALRNEKSVESDKFYTLSKDDCVILQEISGEWYKITYGEYSGYVQANGLTYINPKPVEKVEEISEGISKEKLLANLSFDMALNKPSGLSLEQFQKILSNNEKDINKVFENNAKFFYYIEKQYNVNGIFVAAVGIHESGWGTSSISKNKLNLFGYGASDSNPYGGAYSFSNYSEGIDLIARVFAKYYLNPAGTKIYDNQIATGDFYNGSNLTGINKKYASDKNWANAVYNHMKYLCNKL